MLIIYVFITVLSLLLQFPHSIMCLKPYSYNVLYKGSRCNAASRRKTLSSCPLISQPEVQRKDVIVVTSDSDAHLQHLLDDRDGTMPSVLMPQSLRHVNYRMVIYVNSRKKSKSTLNIFPPATVTECDISIKYLEKRRLHNLEFFYKVNTRALSDKTRSQNLASKVQSIREAVCDTSIDVSYVIWCDTDVAIIHPVDPEFIQWASSIDIATIPLFLSYPGASECKKMWEYASISNNETSRLEFVQICRPVWETGVMVIRRSPATCALFSEALSWYTDGQLVKNKNLYYNPPHAIADPRRTLNDVAVFGYLLNREFVYNGLKIGLLAGKIPGLEEVSPPINRNFAWKDYAALYKDATGDILVVPGTNPSSPVSPFNIFKYFMHFRGLSGGLAKCSLKKSKKS